MTNIIEKALTIKGQFCSVDYSRPCKVKKGSPEIMKITKATSMRVGCEYDALKVVLESKGVETKEEAHDLNQGLRGMHYEVYPVVLVSDKTEKKYIRFSTCANTRFITKYIMDGKEVLKSEIEEYLLASEKNHNGDMPPVINIGVDNISLITVEGGK